MRRKLICIILLMVVIPAQARTVELALSPAKSAKPEQKYQLIVKAEEQIDADAVALYEKAVKLIPKDFNQEQITKWLNLPIEQFPQQQAEEVLQKYLEPLKLVARAAKCEECNWPEWKPGDQIEGLTEYRKLAFILELWARLEISQKRYEGAAIAMRTGFAMARHLGKGPTIIQGLVGAAVGSLMCREVEEFVQMEDSPNSYRAIAEMPRPFVNIENAIENEKKVSRESAMNKLTNGQIVKQLAPAFDRARMISKRLDNNLNGLQCIEAIRHYAAEHAGQLPQKLSDIKELEIPKDVISDKAFEYNRTASGATLSSAIPEGGNERDSLQYEIILQK